MNLPDLVILALVEGVADILPIDATAHALLVSRVVGWRAGTIDAAIHLGAALGLLFYLWRDAGLIAQGLWKLRKVRIEPGTALLAKALLSAAPWLIAVGLLGAPPIPGLSDMVLVGSVTIVAALIMGAVDKLCMTVKRIEHLGGLTAAIIGIAQLFSLMPGVGRLAAALTVARLLGLERPHAFRYVLLVNLPILLAEGGRSAVLYYLDGMRPATSDLLAFGLTFVLVLLAVSIAMAWISRFGLWPFALYRLGIGAMLIGLAFL